MKTIFKKTYNKLKYSIVITFDTNKYFILALFPFTE